MHRGGSHQGVSQDSWGDGTIHEIGDPSGPRCTQRVPHWKAKWAATSLSVEIGRGLATISRDGRERHAHKCGYRD
jgi:hypothetical protein